MDKVNMKKKTKQKHTNYPSLFAIGDAVSFTNANKSIFEEIHAMHGDIVSVTFTKAKVFYNIIDHCSGKLFKNIDSLNVISI